MTEYVIPLESYVREVISILSELGQELRSIPELGDLDPNEFRWVPGCELQMTLLLVKLGEAKNMHSPPRGQGLDAMWLRVVARRAASVAKIRKERNLGYDAPAIKSHPDLIWLGETAPGLGATTFSTGNRLHNPFETIADPSSNSAITLLQKLKTTAKRIAALQDKQSLPSGRQNKLAMEENRTHQKKETLDSLIKDAGDSVLKIIDQGTLVDDPLLDEIILTANQLSSSDNSNWTRFDPASVIELLAACWLPAKENCGPEDNLNLTNHINNQRSGKNHILAEIAENIFSIANEFEQEILKAGRMSQAFVEYFNDFSGSDPSEASKPGGEQQEQLPKANSKSRPEHWGHAGDLIIAALLKHHKYENGFCGNTEFITGKKLAEQLSLSKSTVSDFFKKEFKGWVNYKKTCEDPKEIVTSLKALNREYAPFMLYENADGGADGQMNDH